MPSENFLDLYLAESGDCLRRLTGSALALERGEPGALEEAFRAAHTIKGMAAAIGQQSVLEFARSIEDRLAAVRSGERPTDAGLIDELLQASDAMAVALTDPVRTDPGPGPERRPPDAVRDPLPDPPPMAGAAAVVSVRLAPDTPFMLARALTLVGVARRLGRVAGHRPELPVEGFDGVFHIYLDGGADATGIAARIRESSDVDAVRITSTEATGRANGGSARPQVRTVRVDRERLDRLAEGIAELAVHFATSTNGAAGNGRERAASVVAAMQRTILELRTVPMSAVHDRVARVVRDAARALGKEIDLEFAGGEIELDQAVLDEVADPLMHLLRNAADHGIESPAERESAGKPRRGRIRLEAERDRSTVRLTVKDDGRGIAAERVLAAATERGLAPAGAGADSLLRVLMQPGFTTAAAVSDVSGRGVGLDAVAARIRGLGGTIDMATTVGAGTTFTLRVPFTLAIVHGLRVRVADDEYALPLTHVAEIAPLGPGLVVRVAGREHVVLREVQVPLVRLREVLGSAASGREPAAVVAELGERRVALAVDAVLEHEPIVVKSFDAPAGSPAIFTGATVRADGRPVLLLDPMSVG